MAKKTKSQTQEESMEEKRLAGWVRFVSILFRVLIILGLISSAILIILLISTNIFSVWILVTPLVLILIGIGFAWLEYHLHDRLYSAGSKKIDQIDKA